LSGRRCSQERYGWLSKIEGRRYGVDVGGATFGVRVQRGAKIMKFHLIGIAIVALASTAHAECLSSADAVWAAHPGSHAMWRLRLPGHEGTKCWYSASERKVTNADASTDAAREIRTVSATAVPLPRPRSQDALSDTERAPLPAKPASADEATSILIWGTPMEIDAAWEDLFVGRERGAK
jgi:hypothetical protein